MMRSLVAALLVVLAVYLPVLPVLAGTIARNTKAGGTTDVQSGQTIQPSDLNTDMNTLFNEINGNLTNANISGSAAIAYSKLTLTSSIVTGDITDGTIANADVNASAAIALTKLDDTSGTDDAHDDTTTPGDSESHTLPTTLDGEIEQLRYAIERQALGIAAGRFDATGTIEATFWGDRPVRNLIWIQGINGVVTSGLPSGWTNVNTATLAQEAADAADATAGVGRVIKITAAGSANEGMSYTLTGLKASTRYFFYALVKATSGDTAKLTVTGADATSSFRDCTNTTTATAWTALTCVVQTDATPTDLVASVLAAADTDIVWNGGVAWGEASAVPLPTAPRVAVVEQQIASTAGTTIDGATTDAGLDTNYQFIDDGTNDLDKTVYVPGDGYYIKVTADITVGQVAGSSGPQELFRWRIYQSVAGAALASVRQHTPQSDHDGSDSTDSVLTDSLVWIVKNPTPGASYRYALAGTKVSGNATYKPQRDGTDSSALTIEVIPYGG
jgi:hypothetical protein